MRTSLSKVGLHTGLAILLVFCSFALISATKPTWTVQDKEFYLDANELAFIRPGFVIDIQNVNIAEDGVITARVMFTDPAGAPLDMDGVNTPGVISASAVATYIPAGERQYEAYTTRIKNGNISGESAEQASSDTGGTWTRVEAGVYDYTFGTVLPSGYDRTVTHTISVYGSRNLNEFELGVNRAEDTFSLVPDGSPVTVVRDVIRDASCEKCHHDLNAHGNTGRSTFAGCIQCHQPQTLEPNSGESVDFAVMIHKIHRGAFLPSVQGGKPYIIYGFRDSLHDYSEVIFPPTDTDSTRQCETCHESDTGATQHDAWLTNPNRAACGSCHDDVNFATGENHAGLPQVSDNLCVNCHIPQGELDFDLSIIGAHRTPRFATELPGVVFEILAVQNTQPGQSPVVSFTLKTRNGAPLERSSFNVLALTLAGPTSDYGTFIRENADDNGSGDRWMHTFEATIPEDASGTWTIGIEGRRAVTVLEGTEREITVNDAGENVVLHFSVDGNEVMPRRQVVELAKCNECHNSLSIHGSLRNQIEYCVECHNPNEDDIPFRPADQMPTESIDFRTMIHRIHTGAELSREYTIIGFMGTPHNYNEVHYPGLRQRCDACHVNDSQQVPLGQDRLPVQDPRGFLNPVGPETIACISCHDNLPAASHALANTSALGESCAACHGDGKLFSVNRVHAE